MTCVHKESCLLTNVASLKNGDVSYRKMKEFPIRKLRLADKLLFSTVKINCQSNNKSRHGTGFFLSMNNSKAIVTNRHVIENCELGEFTLTQGKDNLPTLGPGIKIKFDHFWNEWTSHPNDIDLAIMPLKLLVDKCREQEKLPFYTTIDITTIPIASEWEKFIPNEDILMIGYPIGLWDDKNNLPFFKQGITASMLNIDYKDKSEFVINTTVYPGSSGSPIFLLNENFYKKSREYVIGRDEVRLLGVAYAHYIYTAKGEIESTITQSETKSSIPADLGIAIKSTRLNDFENILEDSKWLM